MHGWWGVQSREFNQAHGGRNPATKYTTNVDFERQPQVTITGQNLWEFLSQVAHIHDIRYTAESQQISFDCDKCENTNMNLFRVNTLVTYRGTFSSRLDV